MQSENKTHHYGRIDEMWNHHKRLSKHYRMYIV